MHKNTRLLALAVLTLGVVAGAAAATPPLHVCATVTDLADLARWVGGDDVVVTTFAQGAEDPHFVEAKPGFVKALSRADAFIQIGMDLEAAWAGVVLQGARNPRVRPGAPGHIDASVVIDPLAVPERVDRSMGDVHAAGNPHYLTDPENGRRVAGLLAERFAVLRPEQAAAFHQRFDTFSKALDERLAAWTAMLAPYRGSLYVSDHDMWPYFASRFGLEAVGFLEPKPGLSPTTRHLEAVIGMMRERKVGILLTSPYSDPRHARFVAEQTGSRIVPLAHQVGSRAGTEDYLSMLDYNVRAVLQGFAPDE